MLLNQMFNGKVGGFSGLKNGLDRGGAVVSHASVSLSPVDDQRPDGQGVSLKQQPIARLPGRRV
jgi:hypothetical protein